MCVCVNKKLSVLSVIIFSTHSNLSCWYLKSLSNVVLNFQDHAWLFFFVACIVEELFNKIWVTKVEWSVLEFYWSLPLSVWNACWAKATLLTASWESFLEKKRIILPNIIVSEHAINFTYNYLSLYISLIVVAQHAPWRATYVI